jgi:hypothetical protein
MVRALMRLRTAKTTVALAAAAIALLVLAPGAFAAHELGGAGTYGEADDRVVTNAGFIVIAFFPLLILALSVLQWRLDKRRDARKAAAKARHRAADWQGGW